MVMIILAAALGIAIAVCLYLYSELSFERAVSACKTRTINDTSNTANELYKNVMRMQKVLDDDARLIETLYDERKKLKKDCEYYKGVANVHDLEAKSKKANTASNHTYTINVDSDKLAKEIMKQIKEKYKENPK